MATWYEVKIMEIKPVEVERDTPECVFIKGKGRKSKLGEFTSYHPTREEAVAYLIKTQSRKVESARNRLNYEEKRLATLLETYPAQ